MSGVVWPTYYSSVEWLIADVTDVSTLHQLSVFHAWVIARLTLRYTTPDIHCRDRRYECDGGIIDDTIDATAYTSRGSTPGQCLRSRSWWWPPLPSRDSSCTDKHYPASFGASVRNESPQSSDAEYAGCALYGDTHTQNIRCGEWKCRIEHWRTKSHGWKDYARIDSNGQSVPIYIVKWSVRNKGAEVLNKNVWSDLLDLYT